MFDYIVVGDGLIGSAAARYLSQVSSSVAVIGPSEPKNWQTHQGVFASHYDQGRITRILDPDPVWALLAKRSIEQYATIEQESQVTFYCASGGLYVGPTTGESGEELARCKIVGQQMAAEFEWFGAGQLNQASDLYQFPDDIGGLLERGGAGYINPRSLVQAQTTLAHRNGAIIIRDTANSVETTKDAVIVKTTQGESFQGRKALIAAGAYVNILLDTPLEITLKPRTILMAQLSSAETARLSTLSTLIYNLSSHPLLDGIYMAPPIQYPDGNYYIKIGGDLKYLQEADNYDNLLAWFQTGGSNVEVEALKEVLLALLPHMNVESFQSKPCVTTYTPSNRPYIDAIEAGRIYVAAAGCGSSAKSSNEIGRLAAMVVENDAWASPDFDAADFKINSVIHELRSQHP